MKLGGDDSLLSLIDIKQPISQTTDGGLALTIGTDALNAGVQLGGDSAVKVWGEAGPVWAQAGLTNSLGVFGTAGIDGLGEVGGYAGLDGAAAEYSWNGSAGVYALTSSGLGGANVDAQGNTTTTGSTAAAQAATSLLNSMAAFTTPASSNVPDIDMSGLSGLLGGIFGTTTTSTGSTGTDTSGTSTAS
jgi:hypothetical protein